MGYEYFAFFTAWAMLLSVVAYTLLAIAHLRERCSHTRKNSKFSGVDSSIGDDDSTYMAAFSPG